MTAENDGALRTAVLQLVGARAWDVFVPPAPSTTFQFFAGEPVAVYLPKVPVHNIRVEGQFGLLVWCSWRLSQNRRVICTWQDEREPEDPVWRGLRLIEGRVIQNIEIGQDIPDLRIEFDEGLVLSVFCDFGPRDSDDCYCITTPLMAVAVLGDGSIVTEPTSGARSPSAESN